MITAKQNIAANRARKAEYTEYRAILSSIANDTEANNADRLQAIDLIMKIDKEGVPPVYPYNGDKPIYLEPTT